MSGSGSSSWPTAATRDHHAQGAGHNTAAQSDSLATMVEAKWPTPMAGTPAQNGNSAAGNSDFSRNAEQLARAMWFTPDVPNGGRALAADVSPTGMTPDGRKKQVGLQNQATSWTTPQAHDVSPRGSGQVPTSKAGNACLARDAMNWPTPCAMQDTKGDADIGSIQRREELGKQIALAHRARTFSRPDPETPPHGPTLSQLRRIWRPLRESLIASHGRATWRRLWNGRTKRRLNPIFVEWLMGWPPGHALCDCSATEFTRWQQDMRGALSRLPTASGPWIWQPPETTPEPQQMTLL